MYLLKATGEHEGYTGEMGGYQWVNGFALINRMSDYDYLTRLAKFEDVTPDELFYTWGEVKTVLVVRYGGVGDLLMITPLLEALKTFFSEAEITVACKSDNYSILDGNPSVSGIMPRPATDLPHLIHEFDQVVDLTQSIENCSEAEYKNTYQWICERYGLQDIVTDFRPRYYLKDEERAWASSFRASLNLEEGQKLITFHPEATSPVRSLASQQTMLIAKHLAEAGHKVAILSHSGVYQSQTQYTCRKCDLEQFLCVSNVVDHVSMACRGCGTKNKVKWKPIHENILFTAGKLSLRECAALMDAADYHLGIDSGFMHIAGALNMPQMALFASFDGQLRTSEMRNCTVYQRKFPCGPCGIHIPTQCSRIRTLGNTLIPCMDSFDPEDVAQRALEDMEYRSNEENTEWRVIGDVIEIDMYRRECPVCGFWAPKGEHDPVARKAGYTYFRCPDCECIYTGRVSDAGELAEYQDPGYFGIYETKRLETENLHVGSMLDNIARETYGLPVIEGREDRRLHAVDFGCSVGSTLAGLPSDVWDVWGVDCSAHAVKKARERHGEDHIFQCDLKKLQVRRDRFGVIPEMIFEQENKLPALKNSKGQVIRPPREAPSTVIIARNAFDLAIMSHTLEHLEDPHRAFSVAFAALRPGGLFVSYTPDADLIMMGVTESHHLVTFVGGEHLCIPGKKTYETLAARSGFEMLGFEYVDTATSHVAWFRKPLDWIEEEQG